MYLITEMNWSDIAMGDGNPQTQVALRSTLEDARQAVVDLVHAEYVIDDDEIVEMHEKMQVETFDGAIAFLRDAPGSPEIDIREIEVGGEFQYLSRDVVDGGTRMFNGQREIGAPASDGLLCPSCRKRMRNDAAEKIVQLEKEIARLQQLLTLKK